MKKFFKRFTLYDIIIIAMMAALGIAVKVVLVPLAQIITGPLFIPGGAVAGGIYMMFVVICTYVVKKPFAATLMCLVQTLVVVITGTMGSHGIMSFITYVLPGIGVDLLFFVLRDKFYTKEGCFAGGVVANTIGTLMVNFVFFRLAWIPLLLCLLVAALMGGLGGLIAYVLAKNIVKLSPGNQNEDIDISKQDE